MPHDSRYNSGGLTLSSSAHDAIAYMRAASVTPKLVHVSHLGVDSGWSRLLRILVSICGFLHPHSCNVRIQDTYIKSSRVRG
jgi:hypothetical protein